MSRLSLLEAELAKVERAIQRPHFPWSREPKDRAGLYARKRELTKEIARARMGLSCSCGAINRFPVAVGSSCRLCGKSLG